MAQNRGEILLKASEDTRMLIRQAHPLIKRKLRDAFKMILNDPYCGKALKDELTGIRSLRVGRIRIIYITVEKNTIEIVTIGPRKTIYEDTYKLLSRTRNR